MDPDCLSVAAVLLVFSFSGQTGGADLSSANGGMLRFKSCMNPRFKSINILKSKRWSWTEPETSVLSFDSFYLLCFSCMFSPRVEAVVEMLHIWPVNR